MKTTILKSIIALVFLAIFNVIFFFCGISHTDSTWCSYGFITFAYISLLVTPLLAHGTRSGVLSGSLWLRAMSYFFTELLIGVACILVNPETMQWPLIIQSILLAVFIVLQLMSVLANDATEASLRQQKEESFARQELIDQLQMCARNSSETSLRPLLNRCLDTLSNSPLQTFPDALDADLAVRNAVDTLCHHIEGGNFEQIRMAANKMMTAVQQRNIVIKRCRMK